MNPLYRYLPTRGWVDPYEVQKETALQKPQAEAGDMDSDVPSAASEELTGQDD